MLEQVLIGFLFVVCCALFYLIRSLRADLYASREVLARRIRVVIDDVGYTHNEMRRTEEKLNGRINQIHIAAKVATKTAERAFTLGSSANIGNAIMARNLQSRPRILSREQFLKNDLVKKKVGPQADEDPEIDFLAAVLSDEELDIMANAQANYQRHNGSSNS